ncbi:MAG: TRAP transporter small permease subunit [Lachnospiraceae bacterium]|nr:TRAP transporter small permease subunit [Lachnospiraceae bacterium]
MKTFNKILDNIEKAVITIDSILLVVIAIIVVIQVIARKLNISMTGTEELARYAYVIFAFLAWPIAALRGTDVCVTFLFDKLPTKIRTGVLAVFHIAMSVFAALCVYSMYLNIQNAAGVLAASNRWLHVSWVYVIVAVGLAATVVFNLVRCFFLLTGQAVYVSQDEKDTAEIEAAKQAFEEEQKKLKEKGE